MGSEFQVLCERLTFDKQESTCVVVLCLYNPTTLTLFYKYGGALRMCKNVTVGDVDRWVLIKIYYNELRVLKPIKLDFRPPAIFVVSIRSIAEWLISEVPSGGDIGFDPFLFSLGEFL